METKKVAVAGGAKQQVTFATTKDVAETYSVSIDKLTGTFTVKPLPFNWWLVIGPIIGVIVIGIIAWLLIRHRRA